MALFSVPDMHNTPVSDESLPAEPRRRYDYLQQILRKDKTPLAILLLAGLVGVLAGLAGVAFDKAVSLVQHYRLHYSGGLLTASGLLSAVIISALLAVCGFWLVRRFSRKPAAREFRKSRGH